MTLMELINEANETTNTSFNKEEQNINFEELRLKVGLSQEDIAQLLEITVSYYRKIEKGYVGVTVPIAKKLSEFYQMEIKPTTARFVDPDEVKVKAIEEVNIIPSKKVDLVTESPNKILNKALKQKHKRLANKLVWYYQKVADIRDIIDEVYLKGGDV